MWKKVRYESDRQEKNSKEKVAQSGGLIKPAGFLSVARDQQSSNVEK